MVIHMQEPMVSDYLYKPRMLTAKKLHQLYASEHIDVPSAENIILKQIRIGKRINEDLKDFIDKESADADLMELCMLIDVDLEDIEPINYGGDFNV